MLLRICWARVSVVLVSLLLTTLASPALAQSTDAVHIKPRVTPEKTAAPDADGLKLHGKPMSIDVDLVVVPVTVTDEKGTPVMDLTRNDFELFEGDQQQRVQYFYSQDAPISVGLIVDLSGSMGDKIGRVRKAVDDFFQLADPRDDYFVITFSDKPKLLADTTQSIPTIQSKLGQMQAKGNTALADAVWAGIQKLKSARYQRKALVIFSDGGDNMSRHSLRSVRNLAKESDAEIYAIDICDAPALLFTRKLEEKFGKQWLTSVTEATGGRTIAVDNASKIPKAAAQISRELRNEYVLAYHPEDDRHDGKWRKLKVKVVRAVKGLPYEVYYRTGYMARKDDDEGN